jgi:hypothetical protein
MENINKNDDNIADFGFENVEIIEKDQDINFDWDENEDKEIEEYTYVIKILFIGNTLSGKSFIISKLIEEFDSSTEKLKIKSLLYKRTIGLDKRLHKIIINEENFIIKYYEIASNFDFTRLNFTYCDFLNGFDLLFFSFNKEINYEENLIFLDNFKNSIFDSYLINELNAKYFFEKKLFVINSILKYDDNDKINHINVIRENKARLSIYTKKDQNDIFNNKDLMYFEMDGESIKKYIDGKIKNNNNQEKQETKNLRYLINQIQFDINKYLDFKKVFSDLIYSLFCRKDTFKISSRESNNKDNNDLLKNNTIVKKDIKDIFDLASKFYFEKHRKRIKKKINC